MNGGEEMGEVSGSKRLAINIIASLVTTIVGLGIAFLLTPFLVSHIGKETYSFYPISNNIVHYFTIIVTAFNALASRFITIEIVKKNQEKAQEYSSSVLLTNTILAAMFLLPMGLIVYKADALFDINPNELTNIRVLFSLVFVAMLINIIGSVYGVATFVKERIDLRSYQQLCVNGIRVVLYLVFFSLFTPNIIFVGVVTLVESVFNFVVQVYWTKRLLPEYKISFELAKLRAVKVLLFSGIWSSISSLGNNLLSGLTLVFANSLFGAAASGTLSIANTLPSLCTTIITMMVNVFYPRLTNQYAVSGIKGLEKETHTSQKIMGVIISVPILLLIGMGKEFFHLWMPNENAAELQVASMIYLIPFVVQANMWTLTQVFPVLNKVKKPAIAMVILGVCNVILCLTMSKIPSIGYLVVPIIASALNVVYCVIYVPMCVGKFLSCSVKGFYLHLIKATFASAVVIAITMLLKSIINCANWFGFIVCGGICAVLAYAVFVLFVLDKEQRNALIKRIRNINS